MRYPLPTNARKRKLIVAVTGASGSLYGSLLLEALSRQEDIEEIALVFSTNGKEVTKYELGEEEYGKMLSADPRIKIYNNDDLFSPPASGSAQFDTMIVIPCSMGTLGRVAAGISADLIGRSADVILKERRQLILLARETPLSAIHLRNMAALTDAGAVILPASPSFYSQPSDIRELCMTVIERILSLAGFDSGGYRWEGRQ